ncbi:hypothetical protein [Modestobacter sp. I12A-02662]|uniref:hypothetical protein n=1 Tax=Modestobacter sp. I12A-02662 TaxID=1730496 RepID=UPI0034DF902A
MTNPALAAAISTQQVVLAAAKQSQRARDEAHRKVLADLTPGVYWEVGERADFYRFFYDECQRLGHEVRWPLAASVVATQAYIGSNPSSESGKLLGLVTDGFQSMLRLGNQVIFDDVLPKLHALSIRSDKLKDQAAIDWDSQILSEEQSLIQPLYELLPARDLQLARSLASRANFRSGVGAWWVEDEITERALSGPGRRVNDVPPFTGNLVTPADRWRYGMRLGALFSTLQVTGEIPAEPPPPAARYVDGTRLAAVNTRPNLHSFEALTDGSVEENRPIVETLRRLTPHEQALFIDHERFGTRLRRLVNPLWPTMLEIVVTWRIDLARQLLLLDRLPGASWTPVRYPDIKQLVVNSPPEQRAKVRGAFWRDFFVDKICENDTIVEAVDDLGIANPERQEWIDAEL